MTSLKDFQGTNTRYVGTSRITLYNYDIVHKSLPHCYRTAVGVVGLKIYFSVTSFLSLILVVLLVTTNAAAGFFNMYRSYEPQSRKHYELQRYAARSTVMPHNEGGAPSGPSTPLHVRLTIATSQYSYYCCWYMPATVVVYITSRSMCWH